MKPRSTANFSVIGDYTTWDTDDEVCHTKDARGTPRHTSHEVDEEMTPARQRQGYPSAM
jgi:hypothetical protein